jgi:hypothetical protein
MGCTRDGSTLGGEVVSQESGQGGQGLDFPYSLGQIMGGMWVVVNGMMVVLVTWKSMNQPAYTFIIFLLVQKCEIQPK